MIVLANRPGFPFLGNDFFGTLGKNSGDNNNKNNSNNNNNNVLVTVWGGCHWMLPCAVSPQTPCEGMCYPLSEKENIRYSERFTFSGVSSTVSMRAGLHI